MSGAIVAIVNEDSLAAIAGDQVLGTQTRRPGAASSPQHGVTN